MTRRPLDEFEALFQLFLVRGGFNVPCVDEDYERRWRTPKTPSNQPRCPHGLTYMTCSYCYFRS
jgi:hypothetical protein